MKKYLMASDHAGFELKEELKSYLTSQGSEVIDLGPDNGDKSISYAEQGHKLAKAILKDESVVGIGVCGTGLGISFALNRHKGIRAARVVSKDDARFAKEHNNANALVFGGRQVSKEEAINMVDEFEKTTYEGGRHQTRIDQLDK